MLKFRAQILSRNLLVRLCRVADDAAGRNKIVLAASGGKVKYVFGAIPCGANL
jgi:hypothetical protein